MRDRRTVHIVLPTSDATAAAATHQAARPARPEQGYSGMTTDETLDRLAIWLAEVSSESVLAGNGSR